MNNRIFLIVIVISLLFSSCSNTRHGMLVLDDIETYMKHAPDTALVMLRNMDSSLFVSRSVRARHALLHSIALDKNYIDLTTDSIIFPAVQFYKYRGSFDERFKMLYYLGRILQNAGQDEKAMEIFAQASSMGHEVNDKSAVARCLSAMGMMYVHLYEFEKAIELYTKSSMLFFEVGDINAYVNDRIKIADAWWCLGESEKIPEYLDGVRLYLDKLSKNVLSYYYSMTLRYEFDACSSDDYMETLRDYISSIPEYMINWSTVATAYLKSGSIVKAEDSMRKFILYDDNYMDEVVYRLSMATIYETKNDYRSALMEYKSYLHLSDSIDIVKYAKDTKFIQERYEKDMKILESRNRNLTVVILLIFLAVLLSGSIYYIIRINRYKEELRVLLDTAVKEKEALSDMLESMPMNDPELHHVLSDRIDLLNEIILSHRVSGSSNSIRLNSKIQSLLADTKEYLSTIGMTYVLNNHSFVSYLKSKGLSSWEIGYCCLYIMGYNAKEISGIMNNSQVYKISSEIRRKLGVNDGKSRLESILKNIYSRY